MATFSISAVARKAQATANGSTTEFSFSFSVNTEADVAVFVGTTLKTISTHYTVSITSSTGAGSITFTSGNTPTNGQIVTIMSKTALARSSVYTSGGTINATSLETDFDTNMMLFQQQDERLDRTIIAPVDDATSIDMTLPNKDARKGTVLGFNATSGNPEAGPSITAVQSLADVTTAINLLGTSAVVEDMGLLATSAVIEDMGLLATSAVIEDMGLLATSAVIEDMGLLATSAVIEDMGLLATSSVISDMSTLAGSGANPNITSVTASGAVTAGSLDVTGVATAATFEPDGDTAAGDNAAIGYTAAEGLILTGQGSTSDITLKNDADATVFTVPTGTDDILFPDSAKILMGASSDLQIYHDGSDSYVDDAGTGALILRGNSNVTIGKYTGETMGFFEVDGAVSLYHNNAIKLATTSTGINVTGKATLTSGELTFSGSISDPNGAAYIWRPADNTLAFGTANEERMRIDSSGNLLVGTTDTTLYNNSTGTGTKIGGDGRLDVSRSADTVATFNRTGSSDGEIIRIVSSGTTIGAIGSISGDIALTSISNPIRFSINNSERMRINASGNILIGTTAEPSASQTGVRISGTNGQNFWKSSNSGTSGYDQLAFFNGNGLVGTISTSGSATAYNTSSDYRLKTDAQPITGASDRVLALKPVNFEWIADGTRVDGFLAHEAQAVVPEAVTGTKDAMKDEEYTVTAAKGDIYTPATDAHVDEDGNNVDAINEVIHSADAEQPETLEDGKQWRETTPAVMGTRSVPDMQGIDQSKIVPLLVAALQEALARITALEAG